MVMTKENIYLPVLDSIIHTDIREFAKYLLENEVPEYHWEIGASSTGRHHPTFAIGELGLSRHTVALIRFLNWITELDYVKERIDSRKRDLLIVAGLVHDWYKLGLPEEQQKYTVFEHPIIAAKMIKKYESQFLTPDEISFIASCVAKHMGEFNSNPKNGDELPVPENDYEFLLHLADYLASRKDIEMQFDGWEKPELPSLDTYELDFGRHKGKKLVDVAVKDKGYIAWLRENYGKEPVRSLLKLL